VQDQVDEPGEAALEVLATQADNPFRADGGIGIVMLALSAAVSQVLFGRWAPWRAAAIGSLALAVGMGAIVAAAAADSAVLFTLGAIVTGVAFLGGLRALSSAIPPEHRAATMSAFYLVAYGSLSIPAAIAGFVVEPLGVRETFEIFSSAIILIALSVTAEAWRQRPRSAVCRAELSAQPG
jgi:MFS family permease